MSVLIVCVFVHAILGLRKSVYSLCSSCNVEWEGRVLTHVACCQVCIHVVHPWVCFLFPPPPPDCLPACLSVCIVGVWFFVESSCKHTPSVRVLYCVSVCVCV